MTILYVTPYLDLEAGTVESLIVPVRLCGGGVSEYMNGTLSFYGGALEKIMPLISIKGGVLEEIGLSVSARGGVIEQANIFISVRGGIVEIMAPVSALSDEFYSFVMNTKTTGAAEYTNFPFNSLFKVGSKFYGIKSDGLHQLTGTNDNGADIEAVLVSGPSNLGTSEIKLFPSAYAHMGIGELEASTKVDEDQEWSDPYDVIQDTEGIKSEYISMARGERGVYIQLKIKNAEGSYFDLVKFEQNFVPTGRKRR